MYASLLKRHQLQGLCSRIVTSILITCAIVIANITENKSLKSISYTFRVIRESETSTDWKLWIIHLSHGENNHVDVPSPVAVRN